MGGRGTGSIPVWAGREVLADNYAKTLLVIVMMIVHPENRIHYALLGTCGSEDQQLLRPFRPEGLTLQIDRSSATHPVTLNRLSLVPAWQSGRSLVAKQKGAGPLKEKCHPHRIKYEMKRNATCIFQRPSRPRAERAYSQPHSSPTT